MTAPCCHCEEAEPTKQSRAGWRHDLLVHRAQRIDADQSALARRCIAGSRLLRCARNDSPWLSLRGGGADEAISFGTGREPARPPSRRGSVEPRHDLLAQEAQRVDDAV